MISNFEYIDDLHLVRWKQGSGKLFVLNRAYSVYFEKDGKPIFYTVPRGMETDLASIPVVVPKWIAQKVDRHIEAAVVHDHMCVIKGPWDSETAAEVFNAGMLAANVPDWRRVAMYQAVKQFGPQW